MIPSTLESSLTVCLVESVPNALRYSALAFHQAAEGRYGLSPLDWVGVLLGGVIGKTLVLLFVIGLIVRAVSAARESLSGALGPPKRERQVGRHLAVDVPVRYSRRARQQGRSD